jgi:hypothetical protein
MLFNAQRVICLPTVHDDYISMNFHRNSAPCTDYNKAVHVAGERAKTTEGSERCRLTCCESSSAFFSLPLSQVDILTAEYDSNVETL